jgi:hypothetical protein
MTTNESAHLRRSTLVCSAASRAVRLLIFGLVGWLWFVAAADTVWRAISLAAVLVLAALVGITWYMSPARADRHWRLALDVFYAKPKPTKTINSRRNVHARL